LQIFKIPFNTPVSRAPRTGTDQRSTTVRATAIEVNKFD